MACIVGIEAVRKNSVNDEPLRIVDVAGHSGFLDRLLLDELTRNDLNEVKVSIVDPDRTVVDKAAKYYKNKEPRLTFYPEKAEEFVKSGKKADVVICSWMRPEFDLRPAIEELDPEIIIFVKDIVGDVGQQQSFVDNEKYVQIAAWRGYSGHDIDTYRSNKISYEDENEKPRGENIILIMARKGSDGDTIREKLALVKKDFRQFYPWEHELPINDLGENVREHDDYTGFEDKDDNT